MGSARLIAGVLLASFATSAYAEYKACTVTLQELFWRKIKKEMTPYVQKAAKPVGLIVGASNEISIAFTGVGIIPPALAKWIPMANEMANVAAGSTGKRWIYSGVSKIFADNVAMAAIVGHSVNQGIEHGPLNGALTLGAGLGLTYWFPNKYFHSMMHGIPELIPSTFAKTKAFAKTGKGQAVIGVSLIVLEEGMLLKSEALIDKIPPVGWGKPAGEKAADPEPNNDASDLSPEERESRMKQSTAAYLIEGKLFGDDATNDADRDAVLVYLTGATHEKGLFAYGDKGSTPKIAVSAKNVAELKALLATEGFVNLLSPDQVSQLRERVQTLQASSQ